MFKRKKSNWFQGLLLAEQLGIEEATSLYFTNEFKDSEELEKGVLDYMAHHKNRLTGRDTNVLRECTPNYR